jgi:hypothetical protein
MLDEITLTMPSGQPQIFICSHIKKIILELVNMPITQGGMTLAGMNKMQYKLDTTSLGQVIVPRSPENDSEIIEYLFQNYNMQHKPR